MTNSTVDRLVNHYLTRLDDAAHALPPDRRIELLAEIREHIAASMSGATGAEELAVRTMLDRLGDPADIVAAAVEDNSLAPPPNPGTSLGRRPGIGLEVGAVVMLTVGSLIPLGWFVGVILLWSSGLWRRSEKLLGTLIIPGGPGLALFGGAAATSWLGAAQPCVGPVTSTISVQIVTPAQACTGSGLAPALGVALLLFILIAPIVMAIVLLNRARGRTTLVGR